MNLKKSFYGLYLTIFLCFGLLYVYGPAANAEEITGQLDDTVEKVIDGIYDAWNKHDAEKLFVHYSKDFITSDGINKDQYKKLTQKLWDTYPNIQVGNQKRMIRSQDQYATVSLIDFFFGESKEANKEINDVGKLNAISQGQIFLKKYGNNWKIESDRISFELVTVYYGNAKEYLDNHEIYFGVPEQVKSGEQYSATLYFILPENVQATATINKELIVEPFEGDLDEAFQTVSEHKLERLFEANHTMHNELVSSTIVLSKGIIEPKLEGLLYISKRVNVLPKLIKAEKQDIAKAPFGFNDEKKPDKEQKN